MTNGLVGRKCGMTRIFDDAGTSIPVTVIEVEPNKVSQIKTVESDGYSAIQVSAGAVKANNVNKAQAGHFAKAGIEAGRMQVEFRVDNIDNFKNGDEIKVDLFDDGQYVDVTGVSKGKGFAGVVKRHNFKTQDATHGNSLAHRAPGSIGQNQTPGRVFKGKKMAGQMGNKQMTIQNVQVVKVDGERSLIMLKGPIPGAVGNYVIVKPSVKKNGGDK